MKNFILHMEDEEAAADLSTLEMAQLCDVSRTSDITTTSQPSSFECRPLEVKKEPSSDKNAMITKDSPTIVQPKDELAVFISELTVNKRKLEDDSNYVLVKKQKTNGLGPAHNAVFSILFLIFVLFLFR